MIASVKAIVLKTIKHGESSKIAELYTDEFGRISVIAKGARSNKSKFAGILEPASVISCSFYYKSTREIQLLNSAELMINSQKSSNDIQRISSALTICESLLDTQPANYKNENLFVNASLSLQFINDINTYPFAVLCKYFIELCKECGFELSFEESFSDSNLFFLLGVGASQEIKPLREPHCVISHITNNIACELMNETLLNSALFDINREHSLELIGILTAYLEKHLGKKLYFRALDLL